MTLIGVVNNLNSKKFCVLLVPLEGSVVYTVYICCGFRDSCLFMDGSSYENHPIAPLSAQIRQD